MHISVPNLGWVRVIILTLWSLESKLLLFREIETGDLYFSQVVTLLKTKSHPYAKYMHHFEQFL